MHTLYFIRWLLLFPVLLTWACTPASKANPQVPPTQTENVNHSYKKTSTQPPDFQPAIVLENRASVLAWLHTVAQTRQLIRLPITLNFGGGLPWEISESLLTFFNPPASVPLRVDDSRMGISLSMFLNSNCDPQTDSCSVWLEGQLEADQDSTLVLYIRRYVRKDQEPSTQRDWIWEAR